MLILFKFDIHLLPGYDRMKFIYALLYTGHQAARSSSEKRGILLSNAIGLSLLSLSLILLVFYYIWFSWNVVTAAIPVIGLLAFSVVIMNLLQLKHISRTWICLFIPIAITALSIYSKTIYYQ